MTATADALEPLRPMPASLVLERIPWWLYLAIRAATEEQRLRLVYLEGTLEIMAPVSELHEESKTLIARLLESWATEKDVDLRGFGSTTWKTEEKAAGCEADECYRLGTSEGLPAIAIEIDVASPAHSKKMSVYARLEVTEVWRWRPSEGRLVVFQLVSGGAYEERGDSELLPDVDLTLLSRFAQKSVGKSHTEAVKEYLKSLRTP